jgi:hypothetical protein
MFMTLLYHNIFLPEILSCVTSHCASRTNMNINCPSTEMNYSTFILVIYM